LSSAARNPLASLIASSLAQKCKKNSRGCSSSVAVHHGQLNTIRTQRHDHGIDFVAGDNEI